MPEDFVHDITPLSQVAPVRPHASSIRQERRRRRGGKGYGDEGKKKKERKASPTPKIQDRITLEQAKERDLKGTSTAKRHQDKEPSQESGHQVRHVDIRV